jgi:predicted RNA binding protein YcfA (HicA-like mRNA interferase family)
MSKDLPAITGPELIRLLKADGWQEGRRATHGITLAKKTDEGRTLVTLVPTKPRSLPIGTLMAILKQTRLGRDGLLELLNKKR